MEPLKAGHSYTVLLRWTKEERASVTLPLPGPNKPHACTTNLTQPPTKVESLARLREGVRPLHLSICATNQRDQQQQAAPRAFALTQYSCKQRCCNNVKPEPIGSTHNTNTHSSASKDEETSMWAWGDSHTHTVHPDVQNHRPSPLSMHRPQPVQPAEQSEEADNTTRG